MDLVATYPFAYGERVYYQGIEYVVHSISTSGCVCLGNDLDSHPIAHANICELDTIAMGQVTQCSLFHPKLDRGAVVGDFVTVKSEFEPLMFSLIPATAGHVGVVNQVSQDGVYIQYSCHMRGIFHQDFSEIEVLDLPRALTLPRVRIPDQALRRFVRRPVIIVDTETEFEGIAILDRDGTAFFRETDNLQPFISGRHQVFTILYSTTSPKPDFRVV